jgi:SAM-dependent methyltransferase
MFEPTGAGEAPKRLEPAGHTNASNAEPGAPGPAFGAKRVSAVRDEFACPACSVAFAANVGDGASIRCPGCGSAFPVINRIAHFAPRLGNQSHTANTFGFAWKAFWNGSFDRRSVFGLKTSETKRYLLASLGVSESELKGRRLLDAGTGSGRVPMALRDTGCIVYAVDIHESLDVVKDAVASDEVRVYQADLLRLPFCDGYFDYVWSSGVIHHTPDPAQAFAALARKVTTGGRLFVSVYGATRHHYRLMRHLLPFAPRLPTRVTYLLAGLLALPLYAAFNATLLGVRGWRRLGQEGPYVILGFAIEDIEHKSYRSIVLNLFDQLHPKYQHEHTVDEVRHWFDSNGFGEVVATNTIGMVEMRGVKR